MEMFAILVLWPQQFVSTLANLSQVVFIWNFSSIGLMVSEKTMFNTLIGLQYEWPWLKGQMSTLTFGTYL